MSYLPSHRLVSQAATNTTIKIISKSLLCVVIGLTLASCSKTKDDKTLNLYNWEEYMPQKILDGFEKETGISVNYIKFESNEDMYDNLKTADSVNPYDLAMPSSYFVDKMAKEGLLQELDKSKLSNFKNLETSFTNTDFDPGNKYSIPFIWGSTGLIVNGAAIDQQTVNSWENLWQPEYKNQVMLVNDMRDVFGMSLLTLGYSVNSSNPNEIKAAYDKLTTLIPNIESFNEDDAPLTSYLATSAAKLGMTYNGKAIIANDEGVSTLLYKYPSEGAILWMDNLVIPKDAKNVDAAHQFINYLLLPENAKIISEEIGYAAPNNAALKIMQYQLKNNPTIYPPQAVVEQGEFLADVGDEAMMVYEQYWDKLKAEVKANK